MGRLTTHVLDVVRGRPAAAVRIELYDLDDNRRLVTSCFTNADGRTDQPLLDDSAFRAGRWELLFHVGDYFAGQDGAQGEPPFLDQVPVRFGTTAQGHYHVPLLVSPWSYSTYRGS